MKKLMFLLAVLLGMAGLATAATYNGGQSINVNETDTLHNDLFAAAQYIQIYGPALGDVYIACERADIKAPVGDDLFAVCRELEVNEPVGDNVISFAQTVYVDNVINGDLIVFGAKVHLAKNTHIHGNVFVGTSEFFLDGATVDGNIDGGTGRAFLNGKVGGKVALDAGWVRFDSLYAAAGGTSLTLPRAISENDAKFVPADLVVNLKTHKHFYQKFGFYWLLLSFLVVGVLLIFLCKGFSKDYLAYSQTRFWKNIGLGFLLVVVTPVVAVILLILILTIPLGLILAAAYMILLYLSYIFAALFIGNWIIRLVKKTGMVHMFWSLLTGILCVILFDKIPGIGCLSELLIICFGMGSLIGYIWSEIKPAASTN